MKSLSGYVRLQYAPGAALVAYKTSADVVSKLVTLVVTVAAARALPASDFGVMALAMTTGWILGVASDAGLPLHLATRVAQAAGLGQGGPACTHAIVRSVMRWRWALGGGAAVAGLALGMVLTSGPVLLPFILIIAHQLFGALLDTLAHAYRGLGRTDIESSLSLGHRGAVALGALTVLAVHPSLLWLSIALAVPPLLALTASHVVAGRLAAATDAGRPMSMGLALAEDTLNARRFVKDVAPLGLGVLLSALYFRCDVYFIERLQGIETVGVYNAAFRIVDALRLFPAAALAVAYPALCGATDLKPLRRLAAVLAAAAAIVTIAIVVGARPLLTLVYGEAMAGGAGALQVLAFCMPFFYVNYALTHQLIAWDGQRAYLGIATAALAMNLAGNFVLIPDMGMVGAAISTLLTEVVVLGGCVFALRNR